MNGQIDMRLALQDSRPVERHATTHCDSFFQAICQARGLQSGNNKKRWLRFAVAIFWSLIHLIGIGIFSRSTFGRLPGYDYESLSYFTKVASVSLSLGTELCSAIQFLTMHDEIGAALRRSGRRFQDFWVNFLTSFTLLALKFVHFSLYDTKTLPLETYFRLSEFSRSCFFMIYTDILINLENVQREISALADNMATNDEEILRRKWELRQRIQKVNDMFAWFLALHHLQIFLSASRGVIHFLEPAYSYLDRATIITRNIAVILQLFDLARRSSTFKRLCQDIEPKFSAGIQENAVNRDDTKQMQVVMRFHEDLDTLRNGCFALGAEDFMSFTLWSATCAAVVLQFDFLIVRALNSLGESYGSS